MKKILIILSIALISLPDLYAQKRNQRIESMRVAFITDKLALTPDESAKFWPVYNEFKKEANEIRKSLKIGRNDFSTISDAEADQALDNQIKSEEALFKNRVKYMLKMKEILPARKILMLRKSEEEFKKLLLEKRRERRKNK